MNILFLDQFSDLGGAQQCLLELMPAVQAQGWNVCCAAIGEGRLLARLRDLGIPAQSLAASSLTSGRKSVTDLVRFAADQPRLVPAISRLADAHHADLLYVNGPRLLPSAARVARKTGRPLLFHCHSRITQRSACALAGRSLRHAQAHVIACCRHVVEPLAPYIDADRLRVIYIGVQGPGGLVPPRHSGSRVGVIGRIAPEKGQAEFLQAAKLLAPNTPGLQFVICGAPLFSDDVAYLDRVRRLAEGLPVDFTGWQDDIYSILAGLDILVVPSMQEGVPRVILEAYAAGVPVVAFPAGGIREVLADGKTGFLTDPAPDSLAATLRKLLAAPNALRSVAMQAREVWQSQFTLQRYQRDVVEAIGLTQTRPAAGRSI